MSDRAPSFSWGHININVADLDRSMEFYRKLGFEVFIPAIPYLGLTAQPEPNPVPDEAATALGIPQGTNGRACIMQLGEGFPKLDLTEFSDLESAPPLSNADTGLVRICLASESLTDDVEHLKAQGVAFLSPPQAGHAELADIAVCRDPDGTLIELIQIYPERWQTLLSDD